MNSTESQYTVFFKEATLIIQKYLIKIISSFGIVVNALILTLLAIKAYKHQTHKYIFCKILCNTLICVIGIFYLNIICPNICEDTYYALVIQWFITGIPLRMFVLASRIANILLIINRYVILKRQNKLFELSKKLILFICCSIAIIIQIPNYFAFFIYRTGSGLYAWSLNQFGLSTLYFYYYLILITCEYGITLIISIVMSCLLIYEFRRFSKRKFTLTKNLLVQKREIRVTKFVFALTALNLFTELFSLSNTILLLINDLFQVKIFVDNNLLLDFYYAFVALVIFTIHSIEGILIFPHDNTMRSTTRKIICLRFI